MADTDAGLLDRVVAALSPSWALRRARDRALLAEIRNAYDGAKRGRRTDGRAARSLGPNAEIRGDLAQLRNVSRDFVRNNAFAARAVAVIASNTIGTGIIGQAAGPRAYVDAWLAWSDTTACDAAGLTTLYGLQHQIVRTIAESGEVLIRRRVRRRSDGLPVPLQLQVLEPDYLDHGKDGPLVDGGYIVQGVEHDALGRRVAYWLYREHPTDQTRMTLTATSARIPASEIVHVYRVDRPGQVRGVPWAAPVMLRLRDLADYEEAQLFRQKIAACFAVFVRRSGNNAVAPLGKTTLSDDGRRIETLSPGMIQYLQPDEEVQSPNPPSVDGYSDYTRRQLIAIAAGLGVPYEALTNDLSNVNFSSGRMGWLEFQRNIDAWRWHMLAPALDRIVGWFGEAAATVSARGGRVSWTAPRREMISPKDEVAPMIELARAGITSVPELIRERGDDPDTVLAAVREWNAKVEAAGLVFTSDARQPPAPTTQGPTDAAV